MSATESGTSTASATEAARGVARLARAVENALAEVELSLPQYRMLIYLSEVGASSAAPMAGRLGVSRPSITALADGLVARCFAERTADPADRRRVSHTITAQGAAALARADEAVGNRLLALAGKMEAPEEAETALRGLVQWTSALNIEREAKLADQ